MSPSVTIVDKNALVEVSDVLSVTEITQVLEFADEVKVAMPQNFEVRDFGNSGNIGGNEVTYMNEVFQDSLPRIYAKILSAAELGVAAARWRPPIGKGLGARTIERLEYRPGGHLGWHNDQDSVYTLSVALSQVEEDFQGGGLHVRGTNSAVVSHRYPRGSMLLFRSENDHMVMPVVSGSRAVLVLEFWRFRDADRFDLRPDVEFGVPFH